MPEEFRATATIVDNATGSLRNIKRAFDDFNHSDSLGNLHRKFVGLHGVSRGLGSELNNVVTPALTAMGITSLSLTGIFTGLAKAVTDFAKSAVDLKLTSQEVGVTTEKFVQLRRAAENLHIEPGQFEAGMRAFSRLVGEASQRTGAWNEKLGELARAGLGAFATRFQQLAQTQGVLPALNQTLQELGKLNPRDAERFAEIMFGDRAWGRARRLAEEAERIGKGFTPDPAAAAKLEQSFNDLMNAMKDARDYVLQQLGPAFIESFDKVKRWLDTNRDTIANWFKTEFAAVRQSIEETKKELDALIAAFKYLREGKPLGPGGTLTPPPGGDEPWTPWGGKKQGGGRPGSALGDIMGKEALGEAVRKGVFEGALDAFRQWWGAGAEGGGTGGGAGGGGGGGGGGAGAGGGGGRGGGRQGFANRLFGGGGGGERFGIEGPDIPWANKMKAGGDLTAARAKFAEELKNPETRRQLMALTRAEVGGQNPEIEQAFMESVINRASARGQTLSQAINDRKYYPGTTTSKMGAQIGDADRQRLDETLGKVMAGSNVSGFATGNASGRVGFAGGPQTYPNPHSAPIKSRGVDLGRVDPELRARMAALYAAAPEEAQRGFRINSGFRSREEQAELYRRYRSGRGGIAAPPGHSHHETGHAIDIHDRTGWFHQHAREFGLHFPVRGDYPHAEMDPSYRGVPFAGRRVDRALSHKVEGTGHIRVDVNAPKGTKVDAKAAGVFNTVKVNRGQQMSTAQDYEGAP